MHESPDMLNVIAQCGGIWKYSVIKGLIKPATFRVWMNRQNYIIPVMRRWKGQGAWIYRLPNKFVERYWQLVPKHINEYAIYRSFALLLYYQEEWNLPLKNEAFSRYVGEFSRRPFNGVYYTIDEELHPIVIIVDFYRPVKKIIEIIGGTRTQLLYVTHHIQEIPACITHVLRLDQGRTIGQGLRGEVLKKASETVDQRPPVGE